MSGPPAIEIPAPSTGQPGPQVVTSHALSSSTTTSQNTMGVAISTAQDYTPLRAEPPTQVELQTPESETWQRRHLKGLGRRYPTSFQLIQRARLYIRGPSPPIALAKSPSLFERRYAFRKWSVTVKWESCWLRITQPFTSTTFRLILLGIAYIISLSFLVRANWFLTPTESFVGCTDSFWSRNNGCGLDGRRCSPFEDAEPIDFRCPASCASVQLANIRTIGAEEVAYQPLVVGGGDANKTYRGDSWICASAIHAGVISNSKGGCGSLRRIGSFTNFFGSEANDISAVSFPTIFPVAYRFIPSTSLTQCDDLRGPALAFNLLFTVLLFAVVRPSAQVLYWSLVVIGHWHVTFFSDPRGTPPPISDAFGVFLPTLLIAYVFWRAAFRHVLPSFNDSPLERMLLYLPGFWCGTLLNVVFADLPLDRLTPGDFGRSGAIAALVILGILVIAIVINQGLVIQKTGWLDVYLGNYLLGAVVLIILSQLPGLSLRLHHYIISILLLPGTAFPTRLSAVYQGFLLGMFLNGESRWGFDSIVQTAAELRRDAPLGSARPTFLTNSTNFNFSIPDVVLSWASISQSNVTSQGWDGFSLIIDDVEKYAGAALNITLSGLNWSIPHFFRLAFQRYGVSGDYTRAAIIWPNGTFEEPEAGPS